ncbi:cytochrome P450 [Suillus subalutaceus]|uniref:cytochrome P450 n=1 Tax=Suillus subalutaceus TaxID=48586 RepID=UPI001B85F2CB|nr:cytochrome P450 [Suillus subalutaceus]KAG1867957.1 cytochrome P450 [Suillus subalutaceus]
MTKPPSVSVSLTDLSTFFLALFALAWFLPHTLLASVARKRPLPPGPPTGWFGNFSLPSSYQWLHYAKWKEIYGDIIYVYVLGNPIIVVNSAQAAEELFERRSSKYSSRPIRTMVVELMGWDWLFSSMPYGRKWKQHRSLFHRHFHRLLTSQYHSVLIKETHTTLRNLAHTPDDFAHHLRRTAAAIVMRISYGHEVSDKGDIYVTLADEAMQGLGMAGIFGSFLVDYLPFLKYVPACMPGANFKRQALIWRKKTRAMIDQPFQAVRERMANGTAIPCFAQKELEKLQQGVHSDPDYETTIKNVAGISYAAGADTTVSTLLSFVLAMLVHPEVQKRAQQELDDVLAMDRLPTFADRSKLPFIDCIVWECLRWNPVLPMGLARFVSSDDEYNGYFIPNGTSVLPNVWAILHDADVYPDPLIFSPERFSDQKKNHDLGINKLPWPAFGFGRRMCPGRWLAYESVWFSIACILSVYSIERGIDENGLEIVPEVAYTSSMISRPKPFKCRFIPRSERADQLIKGTAP